MRNEMKGEEKHMQISRSKTTATAASLFLLFAISVSLVALPKANAAETTGTMATYPVIGATPNPVGVGQETLIMLGITQQLYSDLYHWTGLTVTVERPDGQTETLGPFETDSTGLTGTIYVPSMAGNYTLQVHFPEQVIPDGAGASFFTSGIPDGTVMQASDSIKITLVVQEEPITYYPGHALPTEYWTRPIDDQLREWAPIAGNWLTTPRNYYAVGEDNAPDTAHILWTTPLTSGGLVGGSLEAYQGAEDTVTNIGYETGDAYEGKWSGSITMGGKLYYQKYAAADPYKEIECVDLHTGEQLWSKVFLNNLTLTRGQLLYWQTYDNQGVYDYLWATANSGTLPLLGLPPNAGTTWCAFDPFTGDFVYALYGMPSGTFDYGPQGEMLVYTIDTRNGWMTMWNSTNIPALYAGTNYASMQWAQWRPMGKIVNATGLAGVTIGGGMFGYPPPDPYIAPTTPLGINGYQWNVSIPTDLSGRASAVFAGDKVFGYQIDQTQVTSWTLNLNESKGAIGSVLYENSWTSVPDDWVNGNLTIGFGAISNIDNVFTVNAKESRLRYGFSLETGDYLWTISEPIAMLGHLTGGPPGENGYIVYGKLICGTMSGVIQAYDVTNGELVWTYNAVDPYMQVLWSNNFPVGHLIATDGKIYIANLEHSVNQPLPRGGPFICLNATTGDVIWRADGLFRQTVWGGRAVIGDSIIATMDTYDQRVYGIGKGPSATTVTASPKVSVHGSSVVVEGMVTDVSPGTNSAALQMRFPNGVPVVSDANMSDWMLYVYKQFERPADVVGVNVVVSVIDPNNNVYEVGRTTSDATGVYGVTFTPEVPGKYTVMASFEGSGAYYGSYAETVINVDEAPTATPVPTPTPAPMTDTYVLGIGSAILIAVIIGFALLLLRRR
jgi:hypothetical protein